MSAEFVPFAFMFVTFAVLMVSFTLTCHLLEHRRREQDAEHERLDRTERP